jgi:hypothetical protein
MIRVTNFREALSRAHSIQRGVRTLQGSLQINMHAIHHSDNGIQEHPKGMKINCCFLSQGKIDRLARRDWLPIAGLGWLRTNIRVDSIQRGFRTLPCSLQICR